MEKNEQVNDIHDLFRFLIAKKVKKAMAFMISPISDFKKNEKDNDIHDFVRFLIGRREKKAMISPLVRDVAALLSSLRYSPRKPIRTQGGGSINGFKY